MINRSFLAVAALLALVSTLVAGQQFVIIGKVLGVDAKRCALAQIATQNAANVNSGAVVADSSGSFRLTLARGEPKNLFVSDRGRHSCVIPLMTDLDDSVTIEVCLDTLNQGVIRFVPPHSRTSRFARLHIDLSKQYFLFVDSLQALQRHNIDTGPLLNAWADTATQLRRLFLAEQDAVLRGELLLRYYRLTSIHGMVFDTVFFRRNVASIPAYSPLWFFNNYEAYDQSFLRHGGTAFVDSMIQGHSSRELRAFLLFQSAMDAQSVMNQEALQRNYTRLKSEFADIWWAKIADQWLMPVNKIRPGGKIPDFSFRDMNDSTIVYSNSTLRGQFFLLDFWATWCLPCIGELPYVQSAFEKYHSKGLEIIAISSDARRADVNHFRSQKYKMPWRHVWISPIQRKTIHDTFGVTGIPKPILVNPDGVIIAVGPELRGEDLCKVLATFLGQ